MGSATLAFRVWSESPETQRLPDVVGRWVTFTTPKSMWTRELGWFQATGMLVREVGEETFAFGSMSRPGVRGTVGYYDQGHGTRLTDSIVCVSARDVGLVTDSTVEDFAAV